MRDVQSVALLEADCASGGVWGANCTGTVADTVPHLPGLFGKRPADPSWGVVRDRHLECNGVRAVRLYICRGSLTLSSA